MQIHAGDHCCVTTSAEFNNTFVLCDLESADNNTMVSPDFILSHRTCCVPGLSYNISDELLNELTTLNILSESCHGHELHVNPQTYNKLTKAGRKRSRWRKRGNRGGQKRKIETIVTADRPTSDNNNSVNPSNLTHIQLTGKKHLDINLWNARSICNKTLTMHDYILESDVDILVITESWLAEEDPVVIGECTPSGYSLLNFPRIIDKHGGIAIICKSNLNLSISQISADADKYTNFEHACVTDMSKSFHLVAIYRPPPSKENTFCTGTFLDEFDCFLNDISVLPGKPLIMGDLNLHADNPEKSEVARYMSLLFQHDLHQYVDRPTHKKGHILDHVVCRAEDNLLVSCNVSPNRYGSDHHMIECTIGKLKPAPERRSITTRNFKNLDLEVFKSDLSRELDDLVSQDDPDIQAMEYNSRVRKVLDEHCPEQTRVQRCIRTPKWFTEDVRSARRERRKRERKWRKTLNDCDRDKYLEQSKVVNELIVQSKADHFKNVLVDADAKTMYRNLNGLLNRSSNTLPTRASNESLSNKFADFFQ